MTDLPTPARTDVRLEHDRTGDYVLKMLVEMANGRDFEVGITVNVAGTIYSGVLMGRDRWFAQLAEQAGESNSTAGDLVGIFRDAFVAATAERKAEPEEDGEPSSHRISFLHLRDATMINGGQVVGPKAMWRVAIRDVSAWLLGNFSD